MRLVDRQLLLKHCAWCQPIDRGWRSLVSLLAGPLGRAGLSVRWTSGVCARCLSELLPATAAARSGQR